MLDAEALRVYLSALHYSLSDSLLIASSQDIRCLKDIAVEPYVHQVENLKQFVNHHQPRMMLFDEVGLGKTISAGLILAELSQRKRISNFLIACPGILVEQWREELEGKFRFRNVLAGKWADIAERLQESDDDTLKVITTYDAVRGHQEFFGSRTWDFVVADEGDYLARVYTGAGFNPSQRARVFRDMLHTERVGFFLLLTATPLRKNLWQVYSLADLSALPGENPLGPHDSFASTFIQGNPQQAIRIKPAQHPLFRQRMAEISSRTSRRDLKLRQQLVFPERRVETIRVPLDPAEQDLILSYQLFLLQRSNLYRNITKDALEELLRNWVRLVVKHGPRSLLELTRVSEAVCETLGDFPFSVIDEDGHSHETSLSYRLVSEAFIAFAKRHLPPDAETPNASLSALIQRLFPNLVEQFFKAEIEKKRRSNRLEEISLAQSVLSSPAAAARAFARKLERVHTSFEQEALKSLVEKAEAIGVPQKAKRLLEVVRGLAMARPDDYRLLVFTTRRATQDFLAGYLQANGFDGQVCVIRGGVPPKETKRTQDDFNGPELRPGPGYGLPRKHILVSTDAGAAGVNLQSCNTMVNYDLPWVPTILEQRIGRICVFRRCQPPVPVDVGHRFRLKKTTVPVETDRRFGRG